MQKQQQWPAFVTGRRVMQPGAVRQRCVLTLVDGSDHQ
jgi:hypothetical protein